jgi:hypothetical protein
MTDCPSGEQRDLALLYLAGRLPEGEAKAFEAHYFECERCARDVEEGTELRAALGRPAVAPAAREIQSAWDWRPLAAAAAIAFVGLGVWQLTRRPAEEAGPPVMRSTLSEVLDLEVAAGPARSIDLTWPPHPDAASYTVHVLAADDTSVWKAQTNEPRLTIGSGAYPAPEGDKALLVEVEAFDSVGRSVAKSALIPLPKR